MGLGMVTFSVPRHAKDLVWNFIAVNIERLRPVGFNGQEVICSRQDEREFSLLISNVSRTDET